MYKNESHPIYLMIQRYKILILVLAYAAHKTHRSIVAAHVSKKRSWTAKV
jgi:hypothetical protein